MKQYARLLIALLALFSISAVAQTNSNRGIALDGLGNIYVTGCVSDNAFKIELCDTLDHYLLFEGCLTGPAGVADLSCACPDDDADGDVDLVDFARFQLTFTGL